MGPNKGMGKNCDGNGSNGMAKQMSSKVMTEHAKAMTGTDSKK